MNYEYTEQELSDYPRETVYEIAKIYKLSKSGTKNEVVQRILTHQDNLSGLSSAKKSSSKSATSSKSVKSAKSPTKSEDKWDLWVESEDPKRPGEVLKHVGWEASAPPNKLNIYDELKQEWVDLNPEDYNKIVFKKPVKIEVDHHGRLDAPTSEDFEEDRIIFTLEPDTPAGSTLRHVLTEIYRHMFELRDDELNKTIRQIGGEDVYIGHPYFEGLTYNDKTGVYEASYGS